MTESPSIPQQDTSGNADSKNSGAAALLRDVYEGIELTPSQINALSKLEDFLNDTEERCFILRGAAGTGKTFIAGRLIQYLRGQNRPYFLLAPTGKAAQNLAAKAKAEACTIHRLLYALQNQSEISGLRAADGKDQEDEECGEIRTIFELKRNQIDENAVFICDEASLISDVDNKNENLLFGSGKLLSDIFAFLHSSGKRQQIIFIGDEAQLPPVNMNRSPALDDGYLLRHFNISAVSCTLTDIIRQKAESCILKNAHTIRRAMKEGEYGSLTLTYGPDVEDITQMGTAAAMWARTGSLNAMKETIAIAYSNAEVSRINQWLRSRLFTDATVLHPGEPLLVVQSVTAIEAGGSRRVSLLNGTFVTLTKILGSAENKEFWYTPRSGADRQRIPLSFIDAEITYKKADGSEESLATKLALSCLLSDGPGPSQAERAVLYHDFKKRFDKQIGGANKKDQLYREALMKAKEDDPWVNAVPVKFGYALTCHKAQGGEWPNVFVACAGRASLNEGCYRWLYTAMTRASGHLWLADAPRRLAGERIRVADARDTTESPSLPGAGDGASPFEIIQKLSEECLKGSGISIKSAVSHRYQAELLLEEKGEEAILRVWYKGNGKISRIIPEKNDELSIRARALLQKILGACAQAPEDPNQEELPPLPFSGEEAYCNDYTERLRACLKKHGVIAANMHRLTPYCVRFTLRRGKETAQFDVYWKKTHEASSISPVHGTPFAREILDILRETQG